MRNKSSAKIFRPLTLSLAVALLVGGFVWVVWAAPPAEGTVVEGVSVPGVALGGTRAEVEAAYGTPSYCQSVYSLCTYNVGATGSIDVSYKGADGGAATGSESDVVDYVSWIGFDGWVTTAGVNTTLAEEDPDAVVAAYPNADITYRQNGDIYQLRDEQLGIQVTWVVIPYPTPTSFVRMLIFEPSSPTPTGTPPPTPTNTPAPPTPTATPLPPTPTPTPDSSTLHVGDLDGSASSVRGGWRWQANVNIAVHDADHDPVAGATVSGSWSGGYVGVGECSTDSDGRCSLSSGYIWRGRNSTTFAVDEVTHSAFTYQPADNHDPDGDSDGTAITILRP